MIKALPPGVTTYAPGAGAGNEMVVAVQLVDPRGTVLDEQVVARLSGSEATCQLDFMRARTEAEVRARHLNAP